MNTKTSTGGTFAVLFVALVGSGSTSAGDLEPQGPPAPTMKTLQQIEPRTPIHAADFPLVIDTPGSYYLVEDSSGVDGGITIQASNVTIDLMGFTLSGGSSDGISSGAGTKGITIRNGRVSNWTGSGVNLQGTDSLLTDLQVTSNDINGISVGAGSVVRDCVASENGQSGFGAGVSAASGAVIERVTARANAGPGLIVDSVGLGGSVVSDSVALLNGTVGIHGLYGTIVEKCVARQNGSQGIHVVGGRVVDSVSIGNSAEGIRGSVVTISGCNVRSNMGTGILVFTSSRVAENTVLETGGPGATGIRVSSGGGNSHITDNMVAASVTGIALESSGNVVTRNRLSGNLTSISAVSGNDIAPTGTAAAASSPWANIVF